MHGTAVSAGSVPGLFGSINAPSAAYAAFSPPFHYDEEEKLYVGGQFWNGRASTLADQAAQPPLNPVEMAMPNAWAVVARLQEQPRYVQAFREVYGLDLTRVPPPGDAPAPAVVETVYARMTRAIAQFERSAQFSPFTSKYDFVLAGRTELSPQEAAGRKLFEGKGKCSACHPSELEPDASGRPFPPLLTDFTFDNLGLPRNVRIPGNPEPNLGLGGRAEIAAKDPKGHELGKHKVMTLRNIAVTPPYGHNGVFDTLEQITHFYNTRDTLPRVCADNTDPGFGVDCWPAPEVTRNVNTAELGDLGLTAEEEAAIVAFMKTLTDGYPQWGGDPKVPSGTASPFAYVVPPELP